MLAFMWRNKMLRPRYFVMLARLGWLKLRFGKRLQLDGVCFVHRGVKFEIARGAAVHLGRWSWIGRGCKIRAHEGEVRVGAKTALGQECTITAFQQVSIGRECVIADRAMFIDFDHCTAEVERPIRQQGIYKRDVQVGDNVWIGYAACVLRGVTIGENSVLGANAVATRDIPANVVAGGVPARVLREREVPRELDWKG